jgi:hypothetical protein
VATRRPKTAQPDSRGLETGIQAAIVIFGFLVGSGFDELAETGGWYWFAYGMGISVVARFTIGASLHLHLEYLAGGRPQKARWGLVWDVFFLFIYGLLMRMSGEVNGEQSEKLIAELHLPALPVGEPRIIQFVLCQLLLFYVAVFSAGVRTRFGTRHGPAADLWRTWLLVDSANVLALVVMFVLCMFRMPRQAMLVGAGAYVLLMVWDVRSLIVKGGKLLRPAGGTSTGPAT